MSHLTIPEGYTPVLNLYDTQKAIGLTKRLFEDMLCGALNLRRVSAPLFLEASTGLNDDPQRRRTSGILHHPGHRHRGTGCPFPRQMETAGAARLRL